MWLCYPCKTVWEGFEYENDIEAFLDGAELECWGCFRDWRGATTRKVTEVEKRKARTEMHAPKSPLPVGISPSQIMRDIALAGPSRLVERAARYLGTSHEWKLQYLEVVPWGDGRVSLVFADNSDTSSMHTNVSVTILEESIENFRFSGKGDEFIVNGIIASIGLEGRLIALRDGTATRI